MADRLDEIMGKQSQMKRWQVWIDGRGESSAETIIGHSARAALEHWAETLDEEEASRLWDNSGLSVFVRELTKPRRFRVHAFVQYSAEEAKGAP